MLLTAERGANQILFPAASSKRLAAGEGNPPPRHSDTEGSKSGKSRTACPEANVEAHPRSTVPYPLLPLLNGINELATVTVAFLVRFSGSRWRTGRWNFGKRYRPFLKGLRGNCLVKEHKTRSAGLRAGGAFRTSTLPEYYGMSRGLIGRCAEYNKSIIMVPDGVRLRR